MLILLVHELGHFFACRFHRIEATLPFFIPAPTLIGTFGAFIKIKSPFSSKKALFDVGHGRPPGRIPGGPAGDCHRHFPFAHRRQRSRAGGHDPGRTADFQTDRLARSRARRRAAAIILVHPMAFAGWFGLLATAFNLFPSASSTAATSFTPCFGKKSYYAGVASIVVIMAAGDLYLAGLAFLGADRHPDRPAPSADI